MSGSSPEPVDLPSAEASAVSEGSPVAQVLIEGAQVARRRSSELQARLRPRWQRSLLVVISVMAYAGMFPWAYFRLGAAVTTFFLVPALLAVLELGTLPGVLVSTLSMGIILPLFSHVGVDPFEYYLLGGGWSVHLVLVVVCLWVGQQLELSQALREEANERRRAQELLQGAEADLRLVNEELEARVADRTLSLTRANNRLQEEIQTRMVVEEERRGLEAQVYHAQKLKSLGVLAGGVAHDFNNLLAGILGHVELARAKLPGDSGAGHHVDRMENAVLRGASLVSQMLTYTGKAPIRMEPTDLSRLVIDLTDLLELSTAHRTEIRFDCSEEGTVVHADPAQMRQVVMNLVTNASEALGEHEDRQVSVHVHPVSGADPALSLPFEDGARVVGPAVCLEVRDAGCGMDEDTRGSMFEPFFSTKFDGRGLGLASVVGIVRTHEGGIHVQSARGEGTTVRVVLPRSDESAVAERKQSWPMPGRRAGTILVVDDHDDVREVAQAHLEGRGLDVLVASGGPAALELAREHGNR
ncbi:MAG: ATP-binding protein, partial [Myxococcota bacterium]|nr:ATP-binding protein [Myxococcota bacterium]